MCFELASPEIQQSILCHVEITRCKKASTCHDKFAEFVFKPCKISSRALHAYTDVKYQHVSVKHARCDNVSRAMPFPTRRHDQHISIKLIAVVQQTLHTSNVNLVWYSVNTDIREVLFRLSVFNDLLRMRRASRKQATDVNAPSLEQLGWQSAHVKPRKPLWLSGHRARKHCVKNFGVQ